jgi:hypothetical protein
VTGVVGERRGVKIFTVNSANAAAVAPAIDDANEDAGGQRRARREALRSRGRRFHDLRMDRRHAIDDPSSGVAEYEITGRFASALYPAGGLAVPGVGRLSARDGANRSCRGECETDPDGDERHDERGRGAQCRFRSVAGATGRSSVGGVGVVALRVDNGTTPLLGGSLASSSTA